MYAECAVNVSRRRHLDKSHPEKSYYEFRKDYKIMRGSLLFSELSDGEIPGKSHYIVILFIGFEKVVKNKFRVFMFC